MLEVFNNLFMSIAEQMGAALTNTAYSVNIKERRDFSCALFDSEGQLVANAPHQPVHLGSMSESIAAVIRSRRDTMRPGEVYMLNAPYNGGTHLPDVTVVRPVFDDAGQQVIFYVGARAHHADIGGPDARVRAARLARRRRGRRPDRRLPGGGERRVARAGDAGSVRFGPVSVSERRSEHGRSHGADRRM